MLITGRTAGEGIAVTDQVVSFGRLTIIGAGDALGELQATGIDTITSVTLGTRTVGSDHFSGGATLVPTSVPSDAQYVWTGCTVTGAEGTSGLFTLTINTAANTYSYASRAQLEAIVALGDATITGKTATGRSGTYTGDGTRLNLASLSPASTFTINAYTSRGVVLPGINLTSADTVTVSGLTLSRNWAVADGTIGAVVIIKNSSGITISDCAIGSNTLAGVTMEINPEVLDGVGCVDGTASNLTVTGCSIHDVHLPIRISGTGCTFTSNTMTDCTQSFGEFFGNTSNAVITDNRGIGIWANGLDTGNPHSSLFGWTPGAVTVDNVLFEGNIFLVGTNRFDALGDRVGLATGPKMNDITGGNLFTNFTIRANVLGCNTSIGFEFADCEDCEIAWNTIIFDSDTYDGSVAKTGFTHHDIGTGCSAHHNVWELVDEGADANVDASFFVNSHDNVIALSSLAATAGDKCHYDQIFDGPTFTGITLDNVLTVFNPKSGGRLLRNTPKVGAIGTGYYNFSTGTDSFPSWTKPSATVATGVSLTAVTFDGTNDYTRATDATDPFIGLTDGDELTFVTVIDLSADSADRYILQASGDALSWRILPTGWLRLKLEDSSGNTIVEADTSMQYLNADGSVLWAVSLKISTYDLWVMKGNVIDPLMYVTTWKTGTWNINTNTMTFMAGEGGGNKTAGAAKAFFLADEYLDLSNTANIDKIVAQDGQPADWGADGTTLSASARAYLAGDAAAWNAGGGLNLASATAEHKFIMTGTVV